MNRRAHEPSWTTNRGCDVSKDASEALRRLDLAVSLLDRLTWRYGAERAAKIINGQDAETEADIAAWKRLGRRG